MNEGRDLQLVNKPRTVSWEIERMPQGNQRNRRVTIYWSTHPQGEQNERGKCSYGVDWRQKIHHIVPQRWIIDCLKMYNIFEEVMKFIEKIMENWIVELTAGGKSLTELKSQGDIFWGNALSLLLFVIAMMSLNHILGKCTSRYKFPKSQEKLNHLMCCILSCVFINNKEHVYIKI